MDRPYAAELLDAVREFLERELLPTVSDSRLKFQLLVAGNLLSVLERELQLGHALGEQEEAELRGLSSHLSITLASGTDFDSRSSLQQLSMWLQTCAAKELSQPSLLAYLRHHVERKLTIANPRYLEATR